MKKFFVLMVALVVVLSSCQEKYSCDIMVKSSNVRGWVTFKTPVSISQEDMSELKTDLVKIAEVSRSPKELKYLVRHKIRSVGGSGISFEFTTNGMKVSRSISNYYIILVVLGSVIFCHLAFNGREWWQNLIGW